MIRCDTLSLHSSAYCHWGRFSPHPHDHAPPVVLAPGYSALEFVPPSGGQLWFTRPWGWPLMAVFSLTRINGQRFMTSWVIALRCSALFSPPCTDVNGCPLAAYVLSGVQRALLDRPEMRDRVRFISFSFDPENDSPKVLKEYGGKFRDPNFHWDFVTAATDIDLATTLDAYGQSVLRDYDGEGNYMGSMSHILRVFLIDEQKKIRNIYSTSFLHTDTIVNDVRTLLMD